MSKGIVIGRRRVKPRFVFFLLLITMLFVYFIRSCNKPFIPYTVEAGSMDLEYYSDAILVRKEEVYTAPEYGRVVYYANEEERVNKDDLVATIFKANYQEEMVYQLYNVQEKIISYQQENILKNITDQDIKNIQSRLDELVYDIQSQVKNNVVTELAPKEKELRNLLEQRQKLIDKETVPDGYLKKLYEEEEKLVNQLKEWKIDIIAPDSGLISYHIDGLETILNFNAIDRIDIDKYRNLVSWKFSNDRDKKDEKAEVDSPFFRLIDPTRWYIICEINYPKVFFEEHEKISVRFLDFEDKVLKGEIKKILDGGDTFLLVIEFSDDIKDFINIRNANIKLSKTVEGLVIPKEAVVDKKGEKGVFKIKNEDKTFIGFDIIAESDKEDYIIIDRKTSLLEENDVIKLN